jgi:hypothetical protein
MSPALLRRYGPPSRGRCRHHQLLAQSQGDERLVARPVVGATPESPLVLAAPMLACLPEDAPTRDRLRRLP